MFDVTILALSPSYLAFKTESIFQLRHIQQCNRHICTAKSLDLLLIEFEFLWTFTQDVWVKQDMVICTPHGFKELPVRLNFPL